MEITIWKVKGSPTKEGLESAKWSYYTKIYETYRDSKVKKESISLNSNYKLLLALKLAWNILANYKWLDSIEEIKTLKTKKYYKKNKKSNKK